MKRWIIGLVILAVLSGGGYWYGTNRSSGKSKTKYRTVKIERGELLQTVRASGQVASLRLVEVGTQVNGPINKLYVDFNSIVKAGDLVAQIDPRTYEAKFAQDKASLASARANVDQTTAKLTQAEKELARTQKLAAQNMLSETELDAAIANRDSLAAQLKVTQASVAQWEASLRISEANLGYTTIRSPVDGIVITRNVSEGQTVVSSMNAMTLFTIATDLSTIQVEASIPEADIGSVKPGQLVTFTVDAYETTFTGQVNQIRMSAANIQNVVTYPVIITAANPGCKLFPGMTALIVCEVAQRSNVLKVANAALRFKMPDKSAQHQADSRVKSKRVRTDTRPRLWVLDNPETDPRPVAVTLDISDGSSTAIQNTEGLIEGQDVIIGIDTSTGENKTVNPFAPQMPGRRRAH